jgi:tetratricopeptide (TPR) repeat protein
MWVYALVLAGGIALYFASGRLRMPIMFPATILAAMFIAEGWEWLRLQRVQRSGHLRLAVITLMLVLGVAWSWGDWWGVRSERLHHADYERLSNAAFRSGEYERALEYADLAAKEKPDSVVVPMLRGNALYELDRLDEAEAAFRLAVEAVRHDAVAPFNLGVLLYYERGDAAQARGFFAMAVERNPSYLRARAMEVMCAVRLGDLEEATLLVQPLLALDPPPPDRMVHIAVVACHAARGDEINRARATQVLTNLFGSEAMDQLRQELRIAGLL